MEVLRLALRESRISQGEGLEDVKRESRISQGEGLEDVKGASTLTKEDVKGASTLTKEDHKTKSVGPSDKITPTASTDKVGFRVRVRVSFCHYTRDKVSLPS